MLNNQPPLLGALNTNSLFFGVRCDLVNGGEYCVAAAPGERHAQADLYSATVTLSEAASPTISSVSGAGWSGAAIFRVRFRSVFQRVTTRVSRAWKYVRASVLCSQALPSLVTTTTSFPVLTSPRRR